MSTNATKGSLRYALLLTALVLILTAGCTAGSGEQSKKASAYEPSATTISGAPDKATLDQEFEKMLAAEAAKASALPTVEPTEPSTKAETGLRSKGGYERPTMEFQLVSGVGLERLRYEAGPTAIDGCRELPDRPPFKVEYPPKGKFTSEEFCLIPRGKDISLEAHYSITYGLAKMPARLRIKAVQPWIRANSLE